MVKSKYGLVDLDVRMRIVVAAHGPRAALLWLPTEERFEVVAYARPLFETAPAQMVLS